MIARLFKKTTTIHSAPDRAPQATNAQPNDDANDNEADKKIGNVALPILGDRSIMRRKAYGTSSVPIQTDLRWKVDPALANRIANFNRHGAERSGYHDSRSVSFWRSARKQFFADGAKQPLVFYDSNTGKPLFRAPVGRSWESFEKESRSHGWPSFRDAEVVWENVRCLRDGESVSVDGTHLGHNLPDRSGNRYCINLVSVAGRPRAGTVEE
jgi:peptide methionine sulfoxide reductase MsrB|mmetsp:Transcript_34758/g.90662  ORF Transcript_34758/g.90662 Transcript_34758/m.90662 type:complete len:212 (-) Transcript_34758:49-684(-)